MKLTSFVLQGLATISLQGFVSGEDSKVLQTIYISHGTSSSPTFTNRGTITLSLDENDELQVDVQNNVNVNDLIETMGSGFYKVRLSNTQEDGDESVVQTSVPLCSVLQSNFRDEFELTLSPTGSIISVLYKPLVSPLAPSCEDIVKALMDRNGNESSFRSKAKIDIGKEGIAVPLLVQSKPVQGYQWLKQERRDKATRSSDVEAGAAGDNTPGSEKFLDPTQTEEGTQKSFFRRYWYIIVPITIMSMMGGEDPQRQVATSGAAGGAAATGSSTSKQRRGKRN